MPKNSQKEIWEYLSIWWNLEITKEIRSEVIGKYKTIYFIYNADGGLLNELEYWYEKHVKKAGNACELCDISHNKYFVRLDWLTFIRRLKKDYRVKVLHRDEVPQKIKKKNFSYPSVIGETTDNEFIAIMDKISFIDVTKPTTVDKMEQQIKEFIRKVSK